MIRRLAIFLALALLSSCASTVPVAIRTPPPVDLTPAAVIGSPTSFVGQAVRWGGTITEVDNRKAETWIQVVARPLARGGRPRVDEASPGRFLARVRGFIDPAIYAEERALTVVGVLEAPRTQPIGQYRYTFPVVTVREHHLWAPLLPRRRCYLCDPFWWYRDSWDPYPRRW